MILYFFNAAGKTFQHGSSRVTLKLFAAETAAFCAEDDDGPDTGADVAGVVLIDEGKAGMFEMRDLLGAEEGVRLTTGVDVSD